MTESAESVVQQVAAAAASASTKESKSHKRKPAARDGAKSPTYVLVDGNKVPPQMPEWWMREAVVKGDAKVFCIAAASIIAKVTRDRLLVEADAKWPQYGFKQHKGYGTKAHMLAIYEHGPCPIHRMTFAPLRTMFPQETADGEEEEAAVGGKEDGAPKSKKGKGKKKATKSKAAGGEPKRKRKKRR